MSVGSVLRCGEGEGRCGERCVEVQGEVRGECGGNVLGCGGR